jgi:putative transposase
MAHRRTLRLQGFDYRGLHRYFVTACTADRQQTFIDVASVDPVLTELRAQLAKHKFRLPGYCIMPEHAHVLLEAQDESSCLADCIKLWKQRTGYWFRRTRGGYLWQDGYHDRILREDEDVLPVVAYILANPVRRGLVARWDEYPFSGSDVYSNEQITEAIQELAPRF